MTGQVIWITGLSGAGKSTLAGLLVKHLKVYKKGVLLLDGDLLRDVFNASTANHSRKDRLELAMQYARLCRVISDQGITVVIATISLFQEIHDWNRANLPGYYEVYLKVPLDELRRRDPKQIYKRFDEGELDNVAGLDLPIEEPENPDWIVEFNSESTAISIADELLQRLKNEERV
ncbi:MAG: adenylyl-sulfate kinase [Gammaproteobacteria bacterium]